jgi:hypothetical protein
VPVAAVVIHGDLTKDGQGVMTMTRHTMPGAVGTDIAIAAVVGIGMAGTIEAVGMEIGTERGIDTEMTGGGERIGTLENPQPPLAGRGTPLLLHHPLAGIAPPRLRLDLRPSPLAVPHCQFQRASQRQRKNV